MNKNNINLYNQLHAIYTDKDIVTTEKFADFALALQNDAEYLAMLYTYKAGSYEFEMPTKFYNVSALSTWAAEHVFNVDKTWSSLQQEAIAKILIELDSSNYYLPTIHMEKEKVVSAFPKMKAKDLDKAMVNLLTHLLLDNEAVNQETINDLKLGLQGAVGVSRITVDDGHGSVSYPSADFIDMVLKNTERLTSLRR